MDDVWRNVIEARLTATETRQAVEEVHRLNVEKRLAAIEDTLKWLVRLIIGAIVLSVLAFAMQEGLSLR
ncbi:hemolysin XhlA family protein [Oceaniglobus indicus]|uniref:hemolysin XhlA family protein n=1 Tax=Oceaniglobus indicus TaxID=2047749 RepID=UPI000C1841C9|nr:hemolysin XhlA family protein [Oceaniglobus indicus]